MMKGLLAKDIALIKQRGKVMLFLLLWAVMFSFTMDDFSFVVGWIVIIAVATSLSTIAYDEHDNCMLYILSMPVTRRQYAAENYIFSILFAAVSWVIALLIEVVAKALQGKSLTLQEELPPMLIFIGIMLTIIAVSIPPQLKWGAEKGRLVMMVLFAIAFGAILILDRGGASMAKLDSFPGYLIVTGSWILGAVLTAISMAVSIKIMENKEI